jgi:hypothetical protein
LFFRHAAKHKNSRSPVKQREQAAQTVLQTKASLDFSNKLSMNLWLMEEKPRSSGQG